MDRNLTEGTQMASKHEKVSDNNSYQENQMKSPMTQHFGTTRLLAILKSESFKGCQGYDTTEPSTAAGRVNCQLR